MIVPLGAKMFLPLNSSKKLPLFSTPKPLFEHHSLYLIYLQAQKEGWEKQYLYKIGKKKEYLPPSKAEGLERVNKYPKSSKYGRQNPISEQWNSEEQLLHWRKMWARYVNRELEGCELTSVSTTEVIKIEV